MGKPEPSPSYKANLILVNVDLIEGSKRQLNFLKEVDLHPSLYGGPIVNNAIRR